jgi:hypothetical protein
MPIKSFRGLLGDGDQETIRLGTNNGLTGYKIKKFQLLPDAPGTVEHELVCKIYKYEQTAIDGNISFDDNTLLGASILMSYAPTASITSQTTIFDNVVFNQDIYVTAIDMESNSKTNYYIELEQVPLSVDEAATATLKDMRGRS